MTYLIAKDRLLSLAVRVQPGASRTMVVGPIGNELKIALQAPPIDGKANEALVEYLAEILDLPKRSLEITQGKTSRSKKIQITGMAPELYLEKLQKNIK